MSNYTFGFHTDMKLATTGRAFSCTIALVFIFTVQLSTCLPLREPQSLPNEEARIVGGWPASQDVINTHVVVLPFFKADIAGQSCSGTIIGNRYILTAAHCLIDENRKLPNAVSLFVSVKNFTNLAYPGVYATTIYIHKEFRDVFRADIAILRSSKPLFPISKQGRMILGRLPRPQVDKALVAGFGTTKPEDDTARSKILRMTELQLLSRQDCRNAQQVFTNRLNDTSHFCAAVSQDENNGRYRDTCTGDSGGPMFVRTSNGLEQIGITSWGPNTCAVPGNVAWYTNISIYYNDIMQVLDGRDAESWLVHS